MNKYILRTSLVWIAVIIALGAAIYLHSRAKLAQGMRAKSAVEMPGTVTPAAVGPEASSAETAAAIPSQSAQAAFAPIQLTPQRMQSIGVTTGRVEFKPVSSDIRAPGNVDIDQRLISYVQVRFSGYIRQVFANATYKYVRKGDPLFTIYSPALLATEQDYLFARKNQKALSASTIDGIASGADALVTAAEQRLQQLEAPQGTLNQLKATGKPIPYLTVRSPVSGYITEYNALPNSYVQPSTRLYTVAGLSRVWVYAHVFQNDAGRLKPGDPVQITVDSYPGRTFSGRIDQILPQVDLATRTVQVRLVMNNPGLKLKPGMFVNVDMKAPLGRQLVVPASAVVQSGAQSLVFLYQGNGILMPKSVVLGPQVGGEFIILSGLKQHQQVVTSANFLIDSESQLQSAAGSFAPPPPGAGGGQALAGPTPEVNIDFSSDPNPPHKGSNVFRVKLAGPGNKPVNGAAISITFYMPAMPMMGMGAMNAIVKLNETGAGVYEGTGLLGSGGTWQVTITAKRNGETIAQKQLPVNVAGGR